MSIWRDKGNICVLYEGFSCGYPVQSILIIDSRDLGVKVIVPERMDATVFDGTCNYKFLINCAIIDNCMDLQERVSGCNCRHIYFIYDVYIN